MVKLLKLMKRALQRTRWNFFWANFQLPEFTLEKITNSNDSIIPPITEFLCMPPYSGSTEFSKNDISPLLNLIRWKNPRAVLELGTAQGTTAANNCATS